MKFETELSTGGSWGSGKAAYSKDLGRFWAPAFRYAILISGLDVLQRVDRLVVQQNLEVKVRPRGTARVAHAGDDLTPADGVADRHEIVDVVRVAGHVAIAVVDLDELAVAIALAGPDHDARRDGHDLGALAAREIDALVEGVAARERVGPVAELR